MCRTRSSIIDPPIPPKKKPRRRMCLADSGRKAVACIADGRTILAVVPAPGFVDLDRLRELVGAREVRLASEREIEGLYPDCETGAMPPLGPLYGQPIYLDRNLATGGDIAFEAGSHSDAIKVRYDDFVRVVRPVVGDFRR